MAPAMVPAMMPVVMGGLAGFQFVSVPGMRAGTGGGLCRRGAERQGQRGCEHRGDEFFHCASPRIVVGRKRCPANGMPGNHLRRKSRAANADVAWTVQASPVRFC
jgi:hypothetical protein